MKKILFFYAFLFFVSFCSYSEGSYNYKINACASYVCNHPFPLDQIICNEANTKLESIRNYLTETKVGTLECSYTYGDGKKVTVEGKYSLDAEEQLRDMLKNMVAQNLKTTAQFKCFSDEECNKNFGCVIHSKPQCQ